MIRIRAGVLVGLCLGWMAVAAQGQFPYSGNANQDARIDVADAVTLLHTLDQPTTAIQALDYFAFKLLDVNRDDQVDAADLTRLLDVLLGRAMPLPVSPDVPAARVSFNRVPSQADLLQDERKTPTAKISFLRIPSQDELAVDERKTPVAAVSFWYQLIVATPTDVNAWQLGYPSFERQ